MKTQKPSIKRSKKSNGFKIFFFTLILIVCILGVGIVTAKMLGFIKGNSFQTISLNVLSQTIGTEPEKDKNNNINILLVGVGGGGHAGGYLADSIIVGSFDTKTSSATMLSIPRDLYVVDKNSGSKINALFSRGYSRGNKNIASGAVYLKTKVEEVTGLKIPYYVVIDFKGLENLVDALSGVEIDVPQTIYDELYPVEENGAYGKFYLQEGHHILDGATTLKYARSRHSTSDFSRSLRQQQVIDAIKQKMLQKGISPSTIKQYYSLYKDMVTTNMSLQEVLGILKYIDNDIKISNFGLNVSFSLRSINATHAGCFLYYPAVDAFGGASVILPIGATVNKISEYKYIHNFVDIIMNHQQALVRENPKIVIKNAIDKEFARKEKENPSGWAKKMGVKLKKFGFNVQELDNAKVTLQNTTVVLPSTGSYSGTVKVLKKFIPISDVVVSTQSGSTSVEILLGNNFIQQMKNKIFDYNTFAEEKQ